MTNRPDCNKIKILLYALAIGLFFVVTAVIGVKYSSWIVDIVRQPEHLRSLLLAYGRASILIFILLQVVQVVIASIPGELVQIAGGYVFGVAAGTFFSLIGILAGYVLVFFVVRTLGYPLVRMIVPEKRIKRMRAHFLSKKAETIIFLLFLIPGIPKDFLVYIIGLTPVRPLRFFALVAIARLPAMFGASYIGANLEQEDYLMAGVALAISTAVFLAGFFLRDRILHVIEGRLPMVKKKKSGVQKG